VLFDTKAFVLSENELCYTVYATPHRTCRPRDLTIAAHWTSAIPALSSAWRSTWQSKVPRQGPGQPSLQRLPNSHRLTRTRRQRRRSSGRQPNRRPAAAMRMKSYHSLTSLCYRQAGVRQQLQQQRAGDVRGIDSLQKQTSAQRRWRAVRTSVSAGCALSAQLGVSARAFARSTRRNYNIPSSHPP